MRRMILQVLIAVPVLIGVPAAHAAEVTSTASGLICVTAGKDSLLAQVGFLWQLLGSKSLGKAAIAKVYPEAAWEASEVFNFANMGIGLAGGATSVTVESHKEQVPADKLLAALVEELNKAVHDLAVNEYDMHAKRLDGETQRVKRLKNELKTAQEALATMAAIHKVEIDPALAAQKRLRIETELQSLDVQFLGLKARQAVIEQQIAELGKKVSQDPANDEVVKALQARIDVQRASLERMRESSRRLSGTITKHDLVLAEVKLLEAEAELPKYRREAAMAAGGRRIAELKTRLDDTAIELAETEVKRKVLQEQLQQARNSSSQVMTKRIDVELLEHDYRDRAEHLSKLRAEMQQLVIPSLTLLPLD